MARISVSMVEGGVVLEMGQEMVARVVVGESKVGVVGVLDCLAELSLRGGTIDGVEYAAAEEVEVFGKVVAKGYGFHEAMEQAAFTLLGDDEEGPVTQVEVDEVVGYLNEIGAE